VQRDQLWAQSSVTSMESLSFLYIQMQDTTITVTVTITVDNNNNSNTVVFMVRLTQKQVTSKASLFRQLAATSTVLSTNPYSQQTQETKCQKT